MKPTYTIGILCCAAAACATTSPPAELLEARQAYAVSQQSKTARYDPVALHEAKAALDNAEKLYKSDSDSPKTRDAAYVATRRAEQATVEGETAALEKKKKDVERSAEATQAAQAESAQSTESQLRATREQLDQAQRDLQAAQKQSRDAMAELTADGNANVREDARGTVITVAGAFLFASNKASVRQGADAALDKIAFVLKQQPAKPILIEGHTDSTGTAERNLELSHERAETVASYLASRGVSRDMMMIEGAGSERPIASNDTAEGRAANRRVEITVRSDR
jgi:outer membrane protein OmpA-like peptidoglycan-associated protein